MEVKVYREVVRPRFEWWRTLLMTLVLGSFWYRSVLLALRGIPWLLWIGAPILTIAFVTVQLGTALVLEVEGGALRVRSLPFRRRFRTYSLSGLRRAEIWNGGSWYHKEFALPGRKSVFLELSDGTRLVVSSNDPERFLATIRAASST
ncbi:hypothetical protein H5T57_04065 [Candidatus Bipolaricaulota bacterium]|nr:hypothetical protein [Candidatus Bipolaricaulota bacterium]